MSLFRRFSRDSSRPGDFGGTNFDLIGAGDPDAWMVSDAAVEAYPNLPEGMGEIAAADVELDTTGNEY